MPFTLIKGTFHVVGYSPDGDSVRFKAKNNSNWDKLEVIRRSVKTNSRGHAQLRIEAADALETHYKGYHQQKDLADVAADFLLNELGITNVRWGPTHYRVTQADDGVNGYILSRSTDVYGRPVSFVFAGGTARTDGNSYYLDTSWLKQSLNYKLLTNGHAYPMYYTSLFWELREEMTKAVTRARLYGRGVWPYDRTGGATVKNIKSITEKNPIFPKLFRRLIAHLKSGGSMRTFKKYLESLAERILILKIAHVTHFDTVINVKGKRVKMIYLPQELAFLPK